MVGSWNIAFGKKDLWCFQWDSLLPSLNCVFFNLVPATQVIPLLNNHIDGGPGVGPGVTLLKWKCCWAPESGTHRREIYVFWYAVIWWIWKTRRGREFEALRREVGELKWVQWKLWKPKGRKEMICRRRAEPEKACCWNSLLERRICDQASQWIMHGGNMVKALSLPSKIFFKAYVFRLAKLKKNANTLVGSY